MRKRSRAGIGIKAKRPGQKKPYVEDISVPTFSHNRKKLVHRARVIDRDSDQYMETITDYESGETIHRGEEPLSSTG